MNGFITSEKSPTLISFYFYDVVKSLILISAYFDNELQLNESLTMKKYMIKFPKARKELEDLYLLHNIMFASFQNTKKNCDKDFSKGICYRLQGKKYNYNQLNRIKIASYVVSILIILSFVFYSLPAGKTVIDKGLKFFSKNIYVSNPINHSIVNDN